MCVEWVAGSPWNQWPDVHGIGGRMAVESALIHSEPLARNLQKLMYHRRGPMLSNSQVDEVRELLRTHEPKTLNALIMIFGDMEAWRLLGLGIVGISLDQTISNNSEVFLTGGHRHADFFA
jgi:hypothetical protein